MFVLLCRVEGGIDPMREQLEKYIVAQGRAAVEGCGTITPVRSFSLLTPFLLLTLRPGCSWE